MTIHMPVSDSLNSLDREQLLKFAQYLLCEHQNERIVETAQQLLGKLLSRQERDQQEDINMIAGAPDPTAGPGKYLKYIHVSSIVLNVQIGEHQVNVVIDFFETLANWLVARV